MTDLIVGKTYRLGRRVGSGTFRRMLLHNEGLVLGRYDARITGRDADPAAPAPRLLAATGVARVTCFHWFNLLLA